jgi:hypothetical protein
VYFELSEFLRDCFFDEGFFVLVEFLKAIYFLFCVELFFAELLS